jgi:hypothetical protein
MRKFVTILVILLAIFGGIFWWRKLHPPLTDEQQILAAMDGICVAAENRSPRGVANFLAKNFKFGDMKKSEFQNSLAGGILQYRVIKLSLSNQKVGINEDSAVSSGNYSLSLKPEFNSSPELNSGRFDLKWKKVDGEWLIVSAAAEQPLQF